MSLRLFDIIRIDHFRGFQHTGVCRGSQDGDHWSLENLVQVTTFSQAMSERFGQLPIIAEDLGLTRRCIGYVIGSNCRG